MPTPTPRLALLAALAVLPTALAIAVEGAIWVALAWDGAVVLGFLLDALRVPKPRSLAVTRSVEDVVSAGSPNPVKLLLENLGSGALDGEIADVPPPTAAATGFRKPFHLPAHGRVELVYTFNPASRGDHRFGDVHIRLHGPWRLAFRQHRVAATRSVKAYPDLAALARDALALARHQAETGLARLRRSLGEGRAFESLREYTPGDDVRVVDWKATAKRQKPIARQYEPERNQTVMLMLDCGRHMVSRMDERTKLDHAIDAALRLARVSLDRGDLVGLCAFGTQVKAFLPAKKGRAHLRLLVEHLYPLQPELVESNYDEAFNLVTSRQKRRSLIVLFSDLLDEDSSRAVLGRTAHLRPRHLPLVVAAADTAILEPARAIPEDVEAAYARAAARKIVHERERTIARLGDAGAHVVNVPATELSAATINAYLDIKGRGLL